MRIAISCHPSQGGSGVVATELALGLAGRGHEVHMVANERPFRLTDDAPVIFDGFEISNYPLFRYPPHDLSLANKLAEIVVKHDIQIIHAHYAVPHAISAMLAGQIVRPHPVKVVTTLHGTDITLVGSHRDFYRVCRYAMLECDGLTAVSQWLARETDREFDLPASPEVIANFVDCDRFNDKKRAGYPDDGAFQLLHVSNFRPVKRVFDVVRVFHRIRQEFPARLVMVGDGPVRGLAEELAAELGVCDHVRFVGTQVDLADIYRASHLYLLLSEYESFGLSALEAMACATPVLATRSGGLIEVVEDGVGGRLCPVGHVDELAEAALQMLHDRSTWQTYSAGALRGARQRYCKTKILPLYEQFYERILQGAHVGSS